MNIYKLQNYITDDTESWEAGKIAWEKLYKDIKEEAESEIMIDLAWIESIFPLYVNELFYPLIKKWYKIDYQNFENQGIKLAIQNSLKTFSELWPEIPMLTGLTENDKILISEQK